ncbi:MAG: hypothetical protein EVA70_08730 [Parvularculaceae bacterium]|nr:MAG: hypothetical protein EVA70_08730 [Parvularculaceae bacterium]
MRKLLMLAALGAFIAAPASAMTIEFKRDSGQTNTVTLDGEGTATTADGMEVPYTYDEASLTMCFQVAADQKSCVTFAEVSDSPAVGDSVRYTASDGAEGTATILALPAAE